nr:MAG TPA: hypothetical protein [Caudoviricetes sp.]
MVVKINSKRGFPLPPLHLSGGRVLKAYRVSPQAKAYWQK